MPDLEQDTVQQFGLFTFLGFRLVATATVMAAAKQVKAKYRPCFRRLSAWPAQQSSRWLLVGVLN